MTTEGLDVRRHDRARRWFEGVLARRTLVFSAAVAWALVGAWVFSRLPRDLFPNLSLPTVQLLIQSPGRSATELELAVSQPVEQALAGLPGVRRTTSATQSGVVQVIVAFEPGVDPWRSRQLVAERLAQVQGEFPDGTTPPLMTSAAGRLQEIQELVLEGPTVDPMRLRDHAVQVLVPRLQAIPGVARVESLGGEGRQIQVSVSPERMRTAGVSLDQVIEALEGSALDVSAGVLEVQDKQWSITVASLAREPAAIAALPVHTAHGLVPLGDVAEVRDAPEFRTGLARFQGFEAVSLRVVKQPAAETLATARRVREALPELRRTLPEGMNLLLFYDQGRLVQHALGGVGKALLAGAAFVALVLVVLLGSVRGAAIVIALLPLATLGAAIPLALLDLGLNAMTLGGLAIAVGLLVDAGVIMVENLAHRLHESRAHAGAPTGASGRTEDSRTRVIAAGAAEVAAPIATAVLVILAVFIPLLAIGGVAGKLYAPLAVAVAASMALSLVFSFTLVPALVHRLLPPSETLREPRIVTAIKRVYRPALDFALRRGALVQVVALALSAAAIVLGFRLGSDFLPALDEGAIMAQTLLPSDTSLAAIDSANRQFEEAVAEVDGVESIYRRTGRGEITEDPMPTYLSDVLIVLESRADTAAVEREIAEIGERAPFGVELTTPMNMRISEGIGGTPADVQVEIFAADLGPVLEQQATIQQAIAGVAGVATVTVDTGAPLPSWRIVPDDAALRRLDVPREALIQTARAALQGIALEPTYDGPQKVERVVRFPSDGRVTAERLKRLPIVVEEGKIVELGQVATIEEAPAPSMIRRKNGQRRLGFNVRTEGDLGGTAGRIERALASMSLPEGATFGIAGKVEEARETGRRLLLASAVAIALVVILLFFALGRWREVAVVLGTLPVALAGGLVALYLVRETWNASSIVGVIGLFGVAVQNSLVLITQTKELLARGMPFREALREASIGRVRPKLMTAGAAILGLLPMLLGFGGSELERPLAVVLVGGLVTSTLFTLLVLPSVYARFGEAGTTG